MIPRRRLAPPLALMLLVAALGACSSSDSGDGAAPTTDRTTSTTTAPPDAEASTTTTTGGAAASARPVTTRHEVGVDGETRSYLLTVPDPLPPGPVPLVVALHGGFGSGEQFRTTSGLDDQAVARGFVVAYPDGSVDPDGTGLVAVARTWNAGRCCGPAVYRSVDDLAFFDAVVDDVAGSQPVDAEHVLVTGHSNGAMMAFRLACEHPDRIAAVAPVAGSVEVQPCSPASPPSVLAIHGDADRNHPIEGGRGPRAVSGVDFHPLREGMDALASAAGCDAEPAQAADGPETILTWSGCEAGRAVEERIVAGADHPWPGSTPVRQAGELQGEPSQAIDATAEVVEFLLAHRA